MSYEMVKKTVHITEPDIINLKKAFTKCKMKCTNLKCKMKCTLKEKSRQVPEDVKLSGFNNNTTICKGSTILKIDDRSINSYKILLQELEYLSGVATITYEENHKKHNNKKDKKDKKDKNISSGKINNNKPAFDPLPFLGDIQQKEHKVYKNLRY